MPDWHQYGVARVSYLWNHLHLLIFDQAILSPLTCPRQNISSVKKKQRVPVSVYYVNILSFKTTCGKQMQEIFTREYHGCSYSMWGQKLEKTCCYTEHLLKQYLLQNNFLYISDSPLNVLNWRLFFSFQRYFTKNWIFPKIWATHFSCFCWQPMEIVSKLSKNLHPKNLKSFVWCNLSILYCVVGSILPKNCYFG